MKSVARTANLSLDGPRDYPLLLDERGNQRDYEDGMGRSTSKARRIEFKMPFPLSQSKRWEQLGSYRRRLERAKKRHIFLRSYNLSFETPSKPLPGKLTHTVRKVKSAVVSILTSIRCCSLGSCHVCRPPELCAFSPSSLSRRTCLSC